MKKASRIFGAENDKLSEYQKKVNDASYEICKTESITIVWEERRYCNYGQRESAQWWLCIQKGF